MTSNSPPHASSAGSSGPPAPAKPGRSRWHSASWWTGAGGIATLLATVIALVAWLFPRSPDSPPAPIASSSSATPSSAPSTAPSSAPPSEPLSVTIVTRGECPDRFYLPQKLDGIAPAIPPPPQNLELLDVESHRNEYLRTLDTWASSVGGWRETNKIQFSVEGNSTRATILTGLRVNLVARNPLTSMTVLAIGECGGVAPPRRFSVDLSATPPHVAALPGESLDAEGNLVPEAAVSFPFTVSETDPEIFDLEMDPGLSCDCLWTATLSYVQTGRSYTTVIDDGGKPFHSVPASRVDDVPGCIYSENPWLGGRGRMCSRG